tara:strand:- start:642 stop:881 length:240 start_codon:yes stop_codon:yes gene_type:complete
VGTQRLCLQRGAAAAGLQKMELGRRVTLQAHHHLKAVMEEMARLELASTALAAAAGPRRLVRLAQTQQAETAVRGRQVV